MMRFGRFAISVYNHGYFRLDGGAMFGSVPKTIWSLLSPPDDDNRIRLATRSLLIRADDRLFMVDVGIGSIWPEKFRRIYALESLSSDKEGCAPDAVTDIVLTHLHFDHAGGISKARSHDGEDVGLSYPGARIYIQADNVETARSPNPRERASYLEENIAALERAELVLTRGSEEIYPGIWVHQTNGHTRGHQWIEVKNGSTSVAYPSDLIPTSHHLPLPFSMGYDICTETLLREKEDMLNRAAAEDWTVVFGHDPAIAAVRLKTNEKGHYAVREVVDV